MELQFKDLVNDYDSAQEFHGLCLKNGWTNEESFYDFDPLSQFEGDPDFVKLDKEGVCYFFKHENIVWYYTICDEEKTKEILKRFYNNELLPLENNTWDEFAKLDSGLAYRGGSGYCYNLYYV